MITGADTFRTDVIPKLKAAGWDDDDIIEQWHIVAYMDGLSHTRVLRDRQAKADALPALCTSGRLQSQTGEELDALLPSVLDRAFKGEL